MGVFTVEVTGTDNVTSATHAVSFDVTVTEAPTPPLLVPGNWTTYNIEDGPNYGQHNAIAIVDGKPAIVYNREDRHNIMYARAINSKPASPADWVTMTVDDGANRGGTLDIVGWNDWPVIVYEATFDQDVYLGFAQSATPAGASDWSVHEFDIAGMSEPQVEAIDTSPIIVYRTGSSIRYARSTVDYGIPNDASGWTTVDVETSDNHEFPRIAIVGGFPTIAFKHKHSGYSDLAFAVADNLKPDLPSNWTVMVVDDSQDNTGNDIVLMDGGGLPTIGYSNYGQTGPRFLRYARVLNVTPGSGADWNTVDVRKAAQDHYGGELAMAWFDNLPLMFHHAVYVAAPSELVGTYPASAAPSGEADFGHGVLDPAPAYILTGEMSAILLADGTPAFVYRTTDGLKYSYYTP